MNDTQHEEATLSSALGDAYLIATSINTESQSIDPTELDGDDLEDLESMLGIIKSIIGELSSAKAAIETARMSVVTEEGGEVWRNGVKWRRAKKTKKRADHRAIRKMVLANVRTAVVDKNSGVKVELDRTSVAAGYDAAVGLYVSPSTDAKVGKLKELSGEPNANNYIDYENDGFTIVVEADPEDDD